MKEVISPKIKLGKPVDKLMWGSVYDSVYGSANSSMDNSVWSSIYDSLWSSVNNSIDNIL
jgi:hypothetical protein